ncbi:hypothetical protein NKH77_47500 [Streptomyces sp. M19]
MAVRPGDDVPDLTAAALWGLARSARAEQPGWFALADLDAHEASLRALPGLLAPAAEPELAVREGAAHLPRLTRTAPTESAPDAPRSTRTAPS